jgi:hypothetical protein
MVEANKPAGVVKNEVGVWGRFRFGVYVVDYVRHENGAYTLCIYSRGSKCICLRNVDIKKKYTLLEELRRAGLDIDPGDFIAIARCVMHNCNDTPQTVSVVRGSDGRHVTICVDNEKCVRAKPCNPRQIARAIKSLGVRDVKSLLNSMGCLDAYDDVVRELRRLLRGD